MSGSPTALYCINPDCDRPYPQRWGNKFCQACGSLLYLQDRYVPVRKLGTGGFAVTYAVYDLQTQTERVLKVLIESVPKAQELFEQEAQVLASLRHPGVPQVEPGSYFHTPIGNPVRRSLPCLVMEKINGQTLEDLLEQHPQGCPEAWIVSWLHQATEILQVLHQRQIIHRDLKPANLMLREAGQLVMIDFGGVKQMRVLSPAQVSSTRLVSPGYSPPEQIAGSAVQPASDFYALGRTLIHLLTGKHPSELEDPQTGDLQWRHLVSISPAVADLLDEMVLPHPQQRPATAAALQARLNRIAPLPRSPVHPGLARLTQASKQFVTAIQKGIKQVQWVIRTVVTAFWRSLVWMLKAVADTLWSTLLAVVGGGLGTIAGFAIAYSIPGRYLAAWLTEQWLQVAPDWPIELRSDFLMFGLAGIGTALGLTLAGGFRQRRHIVMGSWVGLIAYLLGWGAIQAALPAQFVWGMVAFGAIAPAFLSLGLGLRSHHGLYATVAAAGIAPFLGSLALLQAGFVADLWQLIAPITDTVQPLDMPLLACLAFFGVVGGLLGCCLGVAHYLFVPLARWLGWR